MLLDKVAVVLVMVVMLRNILEPIRRGVNSTRNNARSKGLIISAANKMRFVKRIKEIFSCGSRAIKMGKQEWRPDEVKHSNSIGTRNAYVVEKIRMPMCRLARDQGPSFSS